MLTIPTLVIMHVTIYIYTFLWCFHTFQEEETKKLSFFELMKRDLEREKKSLKSRNKDFEIKIIRITRGKSRENIQEEATKLRKRYPKSRRYWKSREQTQA